MKKVPVILVSVSLLSFVSCKKSSIEPAQAIIKGYALLATEGGNFLSDNSGVTVTIENSRPLISAVSDSHGNFTLPFEPALSSFTLVYTKPGFGTFKRYYSTDNEGNRIQWDLSTKYPASTDQQQIVTDETLGAKSTVTVNSLYAAIIGDTLQIRCNISSIGDGQKWIQILNQKNLPNISINTIDKSRLNFHCLYPVVNGDNTFNFCLKCSALCNDWVRGDAIYFTAYGDSYYGDMYVDRSNNSLVMPNLNTASTVTPAFVVAP